MSNRSRIYKELSSAQIESILKDAFDEQTVLKSYRKSLGGCFNTTYFVESDRPNRKLILRVAPIRQELLLDYEIDMMKSEPVVYQMIADAGVPVSKTVKFDDSHNIINRDYIMIDYIDAISYSSPDFPRESAPQIEYELGLYTRKIHSIKGNAFGWVAPDGSAKGDFKTWYEVVISFVNEFAEKFARYNLLDDDAIKKFVDFFVKNEYVFDINKPGYDGAPSLTHNDLWAPNILVSNVSGEWHIAAIIDADRAMYADREYEFCLWGDDDTLKKGYGIPLDMSEDGKLKRLGYALMLDAHNMYVSKVEYDDDVEYERQKENILNKLR
jgi:Predicted aminoglycoside phosphotransferase